MSDLCKFQEMIRCMESASEDNPVAEQQEAIDKAIDILQTLDQWCNAYPEDLFPPVKNWKYVHEVLEKHNLSGSRIAADCMRHVTEGFKKVLRK